MVLYLSPTLHFFINFCHIIEPEILNIWLADLLKHAENLKIQNKRKKLLIPLMPNYLNPS